METGRVSNGVGGEGGRGGIDAHRDQMGAGVVDREWHARARWGCGKV